MTTRKAAPAHVIITDRGSLPTAPSTTPAAPVTERERPGLMVALQVVPDPRDVRGRRYGLSSLLAVGVCAVLAGACTFAAVHDWVRDLDRAAWRKLGFADTVPAATTLWRLLIRVDAGVLQQALTRWLRARSGPLQITGRRWRLVIAIDGKVLRGSRSVDGRQVHLLAAYDTHTGIVLCQVQIAAKSNEIPAFTPLLDQIVTHLGSLARVLIVADAMHAQTGYARAVAERGGDLMVAVKANQPTLYTQLKALPWHQVPVGDQQRAPGTAAKRPAP